MNIYNKDEMDRLEKNRRDVECGGSDELYKAYFKKCENCGLPWEIDIEMFYINGTVLLCTICKDNHYSELDRRQRDKWYNRRTYESD